MHLPPVRRRHSMPFGAEPLPNGRVRFRLWAPAARTVELCLADAPATPLPMQAEADGWFSLATGAAQVGSRYQFRIDGGQEVPDPASRFQPTDVHGPSAVVDPEAWKWSDGDWRGRPFEEAVFYELHIGSFTPEGNFQGAARKLEHLARLGVTATELMPIAEFPGRRDWGYDGAQLFAPESSYGSPDDFKRLVETAHSLGLMVFLDVVYNHFGPEGNYLHLYAPAFFTQQHQTPWGDALNFDGPDSFWVRQFFIHNALYWLEEFHLDGLRLDAVHAIVDHSTPDILEELANTAQTQLGAGRHIHLVLENDHNAAHYLTRNGSGRAKHYTAQWNDDVHHALHLLITGEARGYYHDYADAPIRHLGRSLTEGFAYQGEISAHRGGIPRGEPSHHLPPTAFVNFLQNHDQTGNRAFGQRLTELAAPDALKAATAVLLLAPAPPLLFMGQEWGCRKPFVFFCDFEPELAAKVAQGRREEFKQFPEFADPVARERIPDAAARASFESCRLDWETCLTPQGQAWLDFHRELLAIRRREILPSLAGLAQRMAQDPVGANLFAPAGPQEANKFAPTEGPSAEFQTFGERGLWAAWPLGNGARLVLLANLGSSPLYGIAWPAGRLLYALPAALADLPRSDALPAWSVLCWHQETA
jgi:maltooligosyltrehalose trehalohydrolase